MNIIKSLFITLTPIWLVYTLIMGIRHAIDDYWFLSSGMILSAAPLGLFLLYILSFRSLARTRKNLPIMQLVSLMGLMLCLVHYLFIQATNYLSLTLAVISYILTLLYIYWYSNNGRLLSQSLAVGKNLPDFTLYNIEGQAIKAADLKSQATILMFTRGNWCPLCMAQIDEVVRGYQQLDQLGVQIAIIASQPEKNTQALAARFNVPIMFLVDKQQQAGQKLGLIHANGLPFGFQIFGHQSDQYYPTVIATDNQGTIIYSDQTTNYRLRPEPEDWLKLYKTKTT